jgi:hypothetical protein
MQLLMSDRLRDRIALQELMKIKFAEMMSGNKIETEDLTGNQTCIAATALAASAVARALQTVYDTAV